MTFKCTESLHLFQNQASRRRFLRLVVGVVTFTASDRDIIYIIRKLRSSRFKGLLD